MGHRFLIGVIVLVGLVGAGCGGDDEEESGGGAGTTAPAAGAGGAAAGASGGGAGAGADMCVTGFMAQGQTADCATCACAMCATEIANLEALSPADRALADAVIDCSSANCCSGTPCYCGDADLAACSMAMPPAGKCVAPIEAAAGGVKGLLMIAGPAGMPKTALGAPSALGRCLNGDASMMMVAKCPACAPTCN